MNTEKIIMCVVALLIGMLVANMLTNVCGCKTGVEGFTDPQSTLAGGLGQGKTMKQILGKDNTDTPAFGYGYGSCGLNQNWSEFSCADSTPDRNIFSDSAKTKCAAGLGPLTDTDLNSDVLQGNCDAAVLPADICSRCDMPTCGGGNCHWKDPLDINTADADRPRAKGADGQLPAFIESGNNRTQFKNCPSAWIADGTMAPDGNGKCQL